MTVAEAVGVGLGFLAIVAPEFWPKMPRALSYTLAGIGLSWLTYSGILGIEELSHSKLQHGPLALIILGAALIACGLFWHIHRLAGTGEKQPHSHAVAGADNEKTTPQLPAVGDEAAKKSPPTLLSLFMTDLKPPVGVTWNANAEMEIQGQELLLFYNVYSDVSAYTKFIAFYVPHSAFSLTAIEFIAANIPRYFSDIESMYGVMKGQGETSSTNTRELTFSGRVYIYHEDDLTISQLARLTELFKGHGANVQFRGSDYIMAAWQSIRSGDIQPRPQYEVRDGRPALIPE